MSDRESHPQWYRIHDGSLWHHHIADAAFRRDAAAPKWRWSLTFRDRADKRWLKSRYRTDREFAAALAFRGLHLTDIEGGPPISPPWSGGTEVTFTGPTDTNGRVFVLVRVNGRPAGAIFLMPAEGGYPAEWRPDGRCFARCAPPDQVLALGWPTLRKAMMGVERGILAQAYARGLEGAG